MKYLYRIVLACLCINIAHLAHAQTDPGLDILDEQLRAEQEQRQSQREPGSTINVPTFNGPISEENCFQIDKIDVRNVTVLKPTTIAPVIHAFEGRCIGQASIGNLIQDISNLYAERGYITTRAYIPAQDISSGQLAIDVLEGRIESFVYQQVDEHNVASAGPARKIHWAFPGQAGDVFQLRDLEHGLEHMNRLASSNAAANLGAGQAPGTTQVLIQEQKSDAFRGTIGADNDGAADTGQTRIRVGVQFDDLFNVNDTYSLSYSGSENTNALAYSMSVPYHDWLFSTYGSYSESLSVLTDTSDMFTQSANLTLHAERVMFRNAETQYHLYGSLSTYWNDRYINAVPLTPQKRSAARIGLRYERSFDTASLAVDTSYSMGAQFWGADWQDGPVAPDVPLTDFRKLEASISYSKAYENGQQFNLTFVGQHTDSPLFSNEQLSIGGWDTVRGHSGGGGTGDIGYFVRADVNFAAQALNLPSEGLPQFMQGASGWYRPYIFVDFGQVWQNPNKKLTKMSGIGAGVNATYGRVTIQAAAALPIGNQVNMTRTDIQGFVNVSFKLF